MSFMQPTMRSALEATGILMWGGGNHVVGIRTSKLSLRCTYLFAYRCRLMKPTLVVFGSFSGTRSHPTWSLSFLPLCSSFLSASISSSLVSTLLVGDSASQSSVASSSVWSSALKAGSVAACGSVLLFVRGWFRGDWKLWWLLWHTVCGQCPCVWSCCVRAGSECQLL